MLAKTLLELKRDKERALTLLDQFVSKCSNSKKWNDKEAVAEARKDQNSGDETPVPLSCCCL